MHFTSLSKYLKNTKCFTNNLFLKDQVNQYHHAYINSALTESSGLGSEFSKQYMIVPVNDINKWSIIIVLYILYYYRIIIIMHYNNI